MCGGWLLMAYSKGAESLPDDVGLAELVHRIQIGDQAAIRDLHSVFSPGIEFLLRRRLQKSAVTREVASILEAVIQEIGRSSQAVNITCVVWHFIHQPFPPVTTDIPSNVADSSRE